MYTQTGLESVIPLYLLFERLQDIYSHSCVPSIFVLSSFSRHLEPSLCIHFISILQICINKIDIYILYYHKIYSQDFSLQWMNELYTTAT